MSVLVSVGYINRKYRRRHNSLRLVHHHRVVGVTSTVYWVGIGEEFGNPYMEAILICRVTITLNTIWYRTSSLKTRGKAASQEISAKDGKGYK